MLLDYSTDALEVPIMKQYKALYKTLSKRKTDGAGYDFRLAIRGLVRPAVVFAALAVAFVKGYISARYFLINAWVLALAVFLFTICVGVRL